MVSNTITKHILLVDDNPVARASIKELVEASGIKVTEAENGFQALEHFRQGRFDLTITDIFMPECDGIETIQAILSLEPTSKIIAISGGGRTVDRCFLDAAKLLGATCCFKKPVDLHALTKKLDELLQVKTDWIFSKP